MVAGKKAEAALENFAEGNFESARFLNLQSEI
jgi:hypothetical protein